jgi:integral membrane sensor domain MASE1
VDIDPEVIKLWFHYEQVAMHFNELIIQYRLQLMSGLGAVGSLAVYLIGGKVEDEARRRWLRALVSTLLTVVFVAAACLDLLYYNELLQGAVDALLALEKANPPLDLSTRIALRVSNRGLAPVRAAYGIVVAALAIFTAWAWWDWIRRQGRQ